MDGHEATAALQRVHTELMGSPPEPRAIAPWVLVLTRGTKTAKDYQHMLLASAEYRARMLSRFRELWYAMVGPEQAPNVAVFDGFWMSYRQFAPVPDAELAACIRGSPQFAARWTSVVHKGLQLCGHDHPPADPALVQRYVSRFQHDPAYDVDRLHLDLDADFPSAGGRATPLALLLQQQAQQQQAQLQAQPQAPQPQQQAQLLLPQLLPLAQPSQAQPQKNPQQQQQPQQQQPDLLPLLQSQPQEKILPQPLVLQPGVTDAMEAHLLGEVEKRLRQRCCDEVEVAHILGLVGGGPKASQAIPNPKACLKRFLADFHALYERPMFVQEYTKLRHRVLPVYLQEDAGAGEGLLRQEMLAYTRKLQQIAQLYRRYLDEDVDQYQFALLVEEQEERGLEEAAFQERVMHQILGSPRYEAEMRERLREVARVVQDTSLDAAALDCLFAKARGIRLALHDDAMTDFLQQFAEETARLCAAITDDYVQVLERHPDERELARHLATFRDGIPRKLPLDAMNDALTGQLASGREFHDVLKRKLGTLHYEAFGHGPPNSLLYDMLDAALEALQGLGPRGLGALDAVLRDVVNRCG
jgi:hypothetical protein